jgi:divalent metal cation (Fe/Co/Zn/Cd) transporter
VKARARFELPEELEGGLRRAVRLEWVTLGFMASIVAVVYLTMGSSQAMKAAWIEDMLSFVAPLAFLISTRLRDREPSEEYPYGMHRAVSIAFLAGAVALLLFGVYILTDSVAGLIRREHPTIGLAVVLSHPVWAGWVMIGALAYSAIPPLILGRMKLPLARRLHDKTLKTDADMNRADWLTAGAGIGGIVGIGVGLWWADGVAGAVISLSIVKDGADNLTRVVKDLVDHRPTTVDGDVSDVPDRVAASVEALEWVEHAEVRLREEGHVFAGEVFVSPRDGGLTVERVRSVQEAARSVDWRVHDVVVTTREAGQGR